MIENSHSVERNIPQGSFRLSIDSFHLITLQLSEQNPQRRHICYSSAIRLRGCRLPFLLHGRNARKCQRHLDPCSEHGFWEIVNAPARLVPQSLLRSWQHQPSQLGLRWWSEQYRLRWQRSSSGGKEPSTTAAVVRWHPNGL